MWENDHNDNSSKYHYDQYPSQKKSSIPSKAHRHFMTLLFKPG